MKEISKTNNVNQDLIIAQLKLLLSEEITKMHNCVEEQVAKIFTDKIDPLVKRVSQESAQLAAEAAVKKYCSRIGIDFDNVEHMQEHNLDMMYLRKMRKEREDVKSVIISSTVKAIVAAGLAYIGLRLTGGGK